MSYTALYRKFRPTEFDEVKGQEPIVTALRNQIRMGRIGHAYLFTGTRGTGKTTVAKIMAKAVNCEQSVNGSPCNHCNSCKAILAGNSMNVIELDAASNNSIDDIRQIIEEVRYSPTQGKYRVYIIDEVHMLSIGAFNALLKTLEEPPSYVIFILATTEVHKLPITILSRCQRFDFRRITVDTMVERLKELSEKEEVEAEEKALRYLAKAADGAMRDALSLYDQCIAFYFGQKLTYDMVLNILGAVDIDIFNRLFNQILCEDITGIMELLEQIMILGKDLPQFVVDFTWYLRNLLLLQTSEQATDLVDASTENLETLKEMAGRVSAETIIRYIRILSELSNQMKYAVQKRVLAEIAFVKMCRPQMNTSQELENLRERISFLEERVENSNYISQQQLEELLANNMVSFQGSEKKEVKANNIHVEHTEEISHLDAVPEELIQIADHWQAVVNQLKGGLKSMIGNATLSLGENNQLLLLFRDQIAEGFVNTPGHLEEIRTVIETMIRKKVQISTKLLKEDVVDKGFPDLQKMDLKKLGINTEIEYID